MSDTEELIERLKAALDDVERLRQAVEALRGVESSDNVEQIRKAVRASMRRFDEGLEAVETRLKESIELTKGTENGGDRQGEAVEATELAKGFRSVIQTMQREASESAVGDVATIIRSMDLELKGLIVVEDRQPKVVPPRPGTTVDPAQLSTIRMSFASIPLQRTERHSPEAGGPVPGEPAPDDQTPDEPGEREEPRRRRRRR